jgi:UDP-GlcNAc:undecaprenyl-phosphate/decaprenyl-phosphate GlcNAc-1-phosphate transferase
MNGLLIASAALGLGISGLACFLVRRWAPAWGLCDAPGGRKTHETPTPLGGGLAIGFSVLLTMVLIGRLPPSAMLLAAGAAMLTLGLIDDRWEVSWKVRLATELLVAGCYADGAMWWRPRTGDASLFVSGHAGPWFVTLAALWIVVQLNAINMLDNMDGLAAGVGAIASAFLAALVWWSPLSLTQAGDQALTLNLADTGIVDFRIGRVPWPDAALPLAMCGALLGFLWHNRSPARLFMGDAGSYFVGFLLGAFSALAVAITGDRPWAARFAPVCVLIVPLYDMVSVVTIRLLAGRSPFVADRNHASHRLVALGLSQRQAVLVLYAATFVTGAAALVVERASPVVGATTIVGLGATIALAGAGEFLAHRKLTRRNLARRK